jgi:hypothetical protein
VFVMSRGLITVDVRKDFCEGGSVPVVARASVAAVHELREGRLDVAAMPSQAVELGLLASAGPLSDKEVVSHAPGRQRFVLVVPADGPFAGRGRWSAGSLRDSG